MMAALFRPIDMLLNKITMYALVLYGMRFLIAMAVVLSFFDVIAVSTLGIIASFSVLVSVCFVVNRLLARLYGVATNNESYIITALILVCILPPTTDPVRLGYLAIAGVIAMVSKFVIAWNGRHIFNPAAIAAVAISLLGLMSVTWWIGNPYMLPFVALVGLLIVRKLRRFTLLFTFMAASLAMTTLVGWVAGQDIGVLLRNAVLSGPLIFFATIMLTEPATMPVIRRYQLLYALLVGVLFAAHLRIDPFSTSPHMVLAAGNIFAFLVNPRYQVRLRLKKKIHITSQIYDYIFTFDRKMAYMPGQYMECTLKHERVDFRGNRRSFTIASSPTESEIHLGVKFYEPASSFKRALLAMKPGETMVAGHLAGDFTLPKDPSEKLVFIAGGIGVTPFRSMLKYLLDNRQQRDVVLFYMVNRADELAYKDVIADAKKSGLRFIPIVGADEAAKGWNGYSGRLSEDILRKEVPDFAERTYMISGPNAFVQAYKDLLRGQDIPAGKIVTDYFPGY
jgi:ferredoxin-NADP reductase/Na+-translocating ferredoxin:NAD+ oxidoreductase RnfD subunit